MKSTLRTLSLIAAGIGATTTLLIFSRTDTDYMDALTGLPFALVGLIIAAYNRDKDSILVCASIGVLILFYFAWEYMWKDFHF